MNSLLEWCNRLAVIPLNLIIKGWRATVNRVMSTVFLCRLWSFGIQLMQNRSTMLVNWEANLSFLIRDCGDVRELLQLLTVLKNNANRILFCGLQLHCKYHVASPLFPMSQYVYACVCADQCTRPDLTCWLPYILRYTSKISTTTRSAKVSNNCLSTSQ